MEYNLEIEKIVREIKRQNAKRVCIQLADGLKLMADEIAREIENRTDAKCIIWLGSCFGACDIPDKLEKFRIDLLIQFGHSKASFKKQA